MVIHPCAEAWSRWSQCPPGHSTEADTAAQIRI